MEHVITEKLLEQIKNITESLGWEVVILDIIPSHIYFNHKSGFSMCAIIDDGITASIEEEIETRTSRTYIDHYGAWDDNIIKDAYILLNALKEF